MSAILTCANATYVNHFGVSEQMGPMSTILTLEQIAIMFTILTHGTYINQSIANQNDRICN